MGSKIQMSHTNKYQKRIAWCCGYKLIYADDRFRKLFKSYLSEHAVYNFINSMIEEIKWSEVKPCDELLWWDEKHFNKYLMKTKKVTKVLQTLLNVGSVITLTLMLMLK